jgi:hypothetical protein
MITGHRCVGYMLRYFNRMEGVASVCENSMACKETCECSWNKWIIPRFNWRCYISLSELWTRLCIVHYTGLLVLLSSEVSYWRYFLAFELGGWGDRKWSQSAEIPTCSSWIRLCQTVWTLVACSSAVVFNLFCSRTPRCIFSLMLHCQIC